MSNSKHFCFDSTKKHLFLHIKIPHEDSLSSCERCKIITSEALGTMHAQHFLIAERERSIYDNCCFDIGNFRAIRLITKGVYIRSSDTLAYRGVHNNSFLTLCVIHKLKGDQALFRASSRFYSRYNEITLNGKKKKIPAETYFGEKKFLQIVMLKKKKKKKNSYPEEIAPPLPPSHRNKN